MFSLLALVVMACAKEQPAAGDQANLAQKDPKVSTAFKLTSTAFKEGETIPGSYTCDGVNVSPSLEWSGVPATAKTLALICDDPDAPAGTWVHWVLYNLPAANMGLIENVPATEQLKGGGVQGTNDFRKVGYGGPCPPSGTHRYFFKLYALDSELPLKPGATKGDLVKAMEGHIVGQTQLMGRYSKT
jgi:Raf kinase inhibitor-like YbhB/YbcL family protein